MDLTGLFKDRNYYLKEVIISPPEIVKLLNQHIIGQDHAKKTIALALFNRSLRALANAGKIHLDQPLKKDNLLMIGPTGSGKTALMKAVSEVMDIPVTFFDVSSLTSAGYVGSDVEDIIEKHVQNASRLVQLDQARKWSSNREYVTEVEHEAKFGILYLDEFDKCKKTGANNSAGRDINGQSVQQELLKILDGEVIKYNSRYEATKLFDSSNLLCVCGGAYVGLEDIVLKRLNQQGSIGFTANTTKLKEHIKDILHEVGTADLVEYGHLPEILGRITNIAVLAELTVEQLCQVLTDKKEAIITEYESYFNLFDIKLIFTPDALKEIAVLAKAKKTGARGLRSMVSKVLEAYQFNVLDMSPKQDLIINKNVILNSFKE